MSAGAVTAEFDARIRHGQRWGSMRDMSSSVAMHQVMFLHAAAAALLER